MLEIEPDDPFRLPAISQTSFFFKSSVIEFFILTFISPATDKNHRKQYYIPLFLFAFLRVANSEVLNIIAIEKAIKKNSSAKCVEIKSPSKAENRWFLFRPAPDSSGAAHLSPSKVAFSINPILKRHLLSLNDP